MGVAHEDLFLVKSEAEAAKSEDKGGGVEAESWRES